MPGHFSPLLLAVLCCSNLIHRWEMNNKGIRCTEKAGLDTWGNSSIENDLLRRLTNDPARMWTGSHTYTYIHTHAHLRKLATQVLGFAFTHHIPLEVKNIIKQLFRIIMTHSVNMCTQPRVRRGRGGEDWIGRGIGRGGSRNRRHSSVSQNRVYPQASRTAIPGP